MNTTPSLTSHPSARVEVVNDNYFGTIVSDPYRWMEQPESQNELNAWMHSHGEFARQTLDQIPERESFIQRLQQLTGASTSVRSLTVAGDYLFFLRREKGAQLAKLIVRDIQGAERVLVDPAGGETGGHSHRTIDNFSPSMDGRFVAYNLSGGGGEIGEVRIIETTTGRLLPDVLERIWGEFEVHWQSDSSGVFYTQMEKEAFRNPKLDKLQNMQVFYHRLGTPTAEDVHVLGNRAGAIPFSSEEFPLVYTTRGSNWMIALGRVARAERRLFVVNFSEVNGDKTPWKVLAEYSDKLNNLAVHGDTLYYISTKDAPYGELRGLSLSSQSLADSKLLVPQGSEVLQSVVASSDALYFSSMNSGVFRLYRLAYGATTPSEIQLPFEGTLDMVDSPADRPGVYFSLEGWTRVKRYLIYRPQTGKIEELGLNDDSPANYEGITVKRDEVPSANGAMVPITILLRKDLHLDGQNPAIITGYGAYGNSRTPRFSPSLLAWLEKGGIFAYAHVRGGGEKGRDWHRAGQGKNKMNGVYDLIACSEYLIRNRYTSSRKLAVRGSSMGGLLVGRAITERPDLFGTSALAVGLLNPLRYLQAGNGANQKAEFDALPDNQLGFETLMTIDPYQHLRAGVKYPSVLLLVGLNDQRVAPWMSAKFVARLEALGANKSRVLMRTDDDEGHSRGATKDQEMLKQADEWAFYLIEFRNPAK